jgi:hypothetical protein
MALARGDTRKGYLGFASAGDDFTIFNEISDGDFVIKGNDGGSTITPMTIDMSASGFVGIGVTDPARELEVSGAGNAYIRIRAASGGSAGYELQNINERWTFFANDDSSDQLEIKNDAGTAMTITTAGAVDIAGTLDVAGAIEASGNITGGMSLYTTRDQVAGALTAGYDLGYLYFGGRDSDSGWHRTAAAVRADVAGTWTSSSCATELQFATTPEGSTSSNEAMIIDSSGKTLVHQINFGYKAGGSALRSDASFINGGTSGSNLSYYSDEDSYWYTYSAGWQQRMRMHDGGQIDGDFNDTSDQALKENISNITGGLSLVKQLRPVNFDWKESGRGTGKAGFIAQEIEAILPNEISGDDYAEEVIDEENPENNVTGSVGKSINVTGIVAHLTKAIQELEARITTLEG